jgi:hypothetical protein
MTTMLKFDFAMVGARVLWRHWMKDRSDERREGFVQEFSPSGLHVRISNDALPEHCGDWPEVSTIRVLEVLETCCVQRRRKEENLRVAQAAARRKKKKKDDEEGAEP